MSEQTTDYLAMGTSIADDVENRSGQPGEPNAPRTQYAGHKVPPAHVRAARRIQMMINAQSGQELDRDIDDRLCTAVEDHVAARERAHGIAVGAWCRAADPYAGYVGDGIRLRGAAETLRHVFGVD